MNDQFTITSYIAELILMHAQGKRISVADVINFADRGTLLFEVEKLGINNYEFIDRKAREDHYDVLKSVISEIVFLENDVLTMNIKDDSGLLYMALKLLNRG